MALSDIKVIWQLTDSLRTHNGTLLSAITQPILGRLRPSIGPVSVQYMCLYNGIIMAHYWQHYTAE